MWASLELYHIHYLRNTATLHKKFKSIIAEPLWLSYLLSRRPNGSLRGGPKGGYSIGGLRLVLSAV